MRPNAEVGGLALDRSTDSSSLVTGGKTGYVSSDAGGWIDVMIGDCRSFVLGVLIFLLK